MSHIIVGKHRTALPEAEAEAIGSAFDVSLRVAALQYPHMDIPPTLGEHLRGEGLVAAR